MTAQNEKFERRHAGWSARGRGAAVPAALAALALVTACDAGQGEETSVPVESSIPLPASTPDASPGMIAGDLAGPVVIEEYADFQCPFCARHHEENHEAIDALIGGGGIRYEYYELAGPAHPQALDATVAARCAGDQGAYAEARHALYSRQEEWSGSLGADTLLRAMVAPLVADPAALDACLDSQRVTVGQILNRNLRRALAEGARSTPTTIVRFGEASQLLPGVVPAETVAAMVEALRSGADDGGDSASAGSVRLEPGT
ncbi:MAG: thioredoxin domain-containing protein [Gemmatimonadota bacterium]